jgi:hypothetical protein
MRRKWVFLLLIVALTIFLVQPVTAVSTTVVIGEFRTRGPNGGNDEFVELYNLSANPVDISGWKLMGSDNSGTTDLRATVPASTVLQPYQHYLFTNSNTYYGPYSGSTPGDMTYTTGISDNGGIAITTASDVIVDQVGMSNGSAYKEGTVLTPMSVNQNQSYARKPDTLSSYGGHKNGTDTDNNANDFTLNSGSSSPENMSSPTVITLSSLTAASPLPAALPVLGLVALGGLAAMAALGIGAVLVRRRRG